MDSVARRALIALSIAAICSVVATTAWGQTSLEITLQNGPPPAQRKVTKPTTQPTKGKSRKSAARRTQQKVTKPAPVDKEDFPILQINTPSISKTPALHQTPEPAQKTIQLTPKQIAAKLIPSVVVLAMLDANDNPVALGSGFVVEPGIIATNYHVIKGAAKGGAKLVSDPTTVEYLRKIEGVVGIDQEHDLALLKVSGIKAPPLALGISADVSIGDTVYAVGNPEGLQGTFSQGLVSGIRGVGLIQITAAISPGSSGGPVADEQGKVIGVATSQFVAGQNLNFAVPSSYLQRLMTKSLNGDKTVVRPLSDPFGLSSPTPVTVRKGEGLPPPTNSVGAGNFNVLKGVKGAGILVEELSDDATKMGLTRERLQSVTELSLRQKRRARR